MSALKRMTGVKMIGVLLLLGLVAQGEDLYNGIRVEGAWPPARALSRAYRPVPYLENRPDVVLIDIGRQLFVDDFLIESTTLKRQFHQPQMHPENPVIRPGIDGQQKYAMSFSDGIFYDPQMKLFRAWYRCDANTCYATSTDGVKWERPELDVAPGTNIVRKGMRDSTSVWLDLNEKDPAKRHKMMVFTNGRLDDAIHFVASPDGIHWGEALGTGRTYKQPNYDRSSMFFNPFRNRWIYSVRVSNVGPLSAPELPPGIGRVRYYKEVENFAEGWKERQELAQWESADERDLPDPAIKAAPQLYNLDATPYESLMLGLFSIWRGPENAEVKDRPKRNEIVLGYSRDGFHWDRPDRRPFIGVSEKRGDWNWGNVQSVGGGCVVVGDNLYFYFSGRRGNPSGKAGVSADGDAGTGLAVLRRDGFASMDAAGEGVLLTRKLRFSGAHLFVNADATRGSIEAEVLDASGHVLEPFSRGSSIAVKRDGTKLALNWKGGRSLAELAGKDVSIRFYVRDARLYAFWISPTPAGESRGFLAAGSMGDSALQDLP
ncbi:MAG: glycosyl hydrolase family 32 [Bryobacterales bacterium]|nr:glycosyl hydrolase family 32 [Bryobacterales bacterium]